MNHRHSMVFEISIEMMYHQIEVMAQGNLDRMHSLSSNGHTPHIVTSSSCLDFHCPIHMHHCSISMT